ncbi:hypothetical protein QJS04_geneDACA010446 [Acorus gramineus]|uniref:Uncharacterized protein n=1 Tax=Acorus gramineus TaxID=55184 RepID=A0AAV9A2C8_ACOGR|nr:hypothetical protein QJS04_geneDACA010446 [Acorus gramineus]
MAKKKPQEAQRDSHPSDQDQMAKKKVQATQKESLPSNQEQISSLKSLNGLLLRETVEKREQVSYLTRSNEDLRAEVALSEAENRRLRSECETFEDRSILSDLERTVILAFVSSHREQLEGLVKGEISLFEAEGACLREKLRRAMDVAVAKGSELIELRRARSEDQVENGRLRMVIEGLEKSKSETEAGIERLRRLLEESRKRFDDLVVEKSDVERDLHFALHERDSDRTVIGQYKESEIDLVTRLGEVEGEVQALKSKLHSASDEKDLNRTALDRLKEEAMNLSMELQKVDGEKEDVERAHDRDVRKIFELESKLIDLENHLKNREKAIESVMEEKALVEKRLTESVLSIENLKSDLEKAITDKEEIFKVNGWLTDDLRLQRDELDAAIGLQSSLREDVNRLSSDTEQMKIDRDAKAAEMKGFISERDTIRAELQLRVAELGLLNSRFSEMEERRAEEKAEMEMSLGEARRRIETMVREVEEKERVAEELKVTLAAAEKGKGLWTLVSSVTTVFAAAASVAYVVKVR